MHSKLIITYQLWFSVCLDKTYITENWKYWNKIIFKYINNDVKPICNENFIKKEIHKSRKQYIKPTPSAFTLLNWNAFERKRRFKRVHIQTHTYKKYLKIIVICHFLPDIFIPLNAFVPCVVGSKKTSEDFLLVLHWVVNKLPISILSNCLYQYFNILNKLKKKNLLSIDRTSFIGTPRIKLTRKWLVMCIDFQSSTETKKYEATE